MAHIHELIDFAITVFIVNKNRVLLIHHKKLNMWLAVGGHIELDEDPEQALFREVKEECGLEITVLGEKPTVKSEVGKSLYAPAFLNIHNFSETHKHVGLVYFAKSDSDQIIHNKDEHNDIRWFTKEELNKPELKLDPLVRFYAQKALEL